MAEKILFILILFFICIGCEQRKPWQCEENGVVYDTCYQTWHEAHNIGAWRKIKGKDTVDMESRMIPPSPEMMEQIRQRELKENKRH